MSMSTRRHGDKNGHSAKEEIHLPEPERHQLQKKIFLFVESGESEIELPNLTNAQRKYLHRFAARQGLKTRSTGNKNNRILHLSQRKQRTDLGLAQPLILSKETSALLKKLSRTVSWQLNSTENAIQQAKKDHPHKNINKHHYNRGDLLFGMHHNHPGPGWIPLEPYMKPTKYGAQLKRDREELPIFRYHDEILSMIQNNSIFIINGETGCGKTTQVPQYILEDARLNNRACMLVVSEPRRIAAVSSAKRVSEERGEMVGDTVGYQIRMERRLTNTTCAIYTTSGCLLRAIMADFQLMCKNVTHLIIDEIHERDKYTDFTLIAIKEQLKKNRTLKVILMSATMDIKQLSTYFNNCPVLNVPGQGYDVKIYHLEDILFHTGYRTALMEKYLRSLETKQPVKESYSMYVNTTLDFLLDACAEERTEEELCEFFDQIQYCMDNENLCVDTAHSGTGLTPLMAACKYNCPKYVESFAMRDANTQLRDACGYSAADYALAHPDGICLGILAKYVGSGAQPQLQSQLRQSAADERERLLTAYHQQFNDDNEVDHDLILSLVEGLYRSSHTGAIMVFLPGYNDIVQQRDLITSTLPRDTYQISILHGQMDTHVYHTILKPSSFKVRRVILATNIAQTSITIPDLAYIIDSGKVKMKTYDVVTESSQLQSVWISQADANQRAGRAGRTQNGVCYRLYSNQKFHSMSSFFIPEFMRIPLTEICLYAKTLDQNCDVQSYLARSLNPPSTLSVQNAIRKLQLLDIFTADERVTPLGEQLVQLPLDVQLGKCLLYSIFYGCVDPVLTIVAFHSVKDPFILPADRAAQGQSSFIRKSFAGESYSDEMGILRLYKEYLAMGRKPNRITEFCNKHYLSQTAMEMFDATRCQLAEHLKHRYRLKSFNNDWQLVRLCLVAGFYPNVAWVDRVHSTLVAGAEKHLILHRTSALNPPGMKKLKDFISKLPHDWVVYYEKSRMGSSCSINMNTLVPGILILLQCGLNCELTPIDDGDDDDVSSDAASIASADDDCTSSDVQQALKNLTVNDAKEAGTGTSPTLISLDNWIQFTLNSPSDVEHLMRMRKLIQRQFYAFLRIGPQPKTTGATELVQQLLAVATATNNDKCPL